MPMNFLDLPPTIHTVPSAIPNLEHNSKMSKKLQFVIQQVLVMITNALAEWNMVTSFGSAYLQFPFYILFNQVKANQVSLDS